MEGRPQRAQRVGASAASDVDRGQGVEAAPAADTTTVMSVVVDAAPAADTTTAPASEVVDPMVKPTPYLSKRRSKKP